MEYTIQARGGYKLDTKDQEQFEAAADRIGDLVSQFPVATLHATVNFHHRAQDLHLKLSLSLPGKQVFTGERGESFVTVLEEATRQMMKNLEKYVSKLKGKDGYAERRERMHSGALPDIEKVKESVENRDYSAFRDELFGLEDEISEAVGKKVRNHPRLGPLEGTAFQRYEVVDLVYAEAYAHFNERPDNLTYHDWILGLVNDVLKEFEPRMDEERKEAQMRRQAQGM